MKIRKLFSRYLIGALLVIFTSTHYAKGYAILAHEAIIDATWEQQLKPLLRQKYPSTPDSLIKKAHAYAYGGALVADMGYMPLGSAEFSDMMHYVRSGEMIETLLNEAQNINEYAFALGALSHYVADEYGHSRATNLTVPILYKKLRKKYGNFVTYGDDNLSHSRVEFSFDVLQVARGNYNSQAYHDFIGFAISKPVLDRAFLKVYGERLDDIFGDFDSSVKTLRWGVNKLFPTLIKRTWKAERDTIMKRQPGMTARKFKYKMNKRQYFQEFGKGREKPGFWASVTTFIIRVMPKIGPLKTLKYVDPGQQGEKLFVKAFDTILISYTDRVHKAAKNELHLSDIDFDTGRRTVIGEYALADQTYADWVIYLADKKFKYLTPELKQHLVTYFKDERHMINDKHYPIHKDELAKALDSLRQAPTVSQNQLLIGSTK